VTGFIASVITADSIFLAFSCLVDRCVPLAFILPSAPQFCILDTPCMNKDLNTKDNKGNPRTSFVGFVSLCGKKGFCLRKFARLTMNLRSLKFVVTHLKAST